LGLGDVLWLKLRVAIAKADRDMQEVLECCGLLRGTYDENSTKTLIALAQAHLYFGNWDQAGRAADEILATNATLAMGINLKYESLVQIAGEDGFAKALEDWVFGPTGRPEYARMLPFLGAHSPANRIVSQRLVQRAHETWPGHPVVRAIIANTGMMVTGDGTLSKRQSPSGTDLNRLSAFQAIGPGLLEITTEWVDYTGLDRVLYEQIAESDLKRPLVADDPQLDVIVTDPGPSGEIAIAFTGANDQVMMPLAVLDAYFAAAGIGAIYLRDRARLLFCAGVDSLGGDFQSTVESLRHLIVQMGGGETLTVYGMSGGGLGAIRFGLALNADRVVCFSGPTNATLDFINRQNDQRARLMVNRLHRRIPDADLACRDLIHNDANPPRIEMIYGADSRLDRAQSEDLTGLESVELLPLSGKTGHESLRKIILLGELPDLIAGQMDGVRSHCDTG